MPELKQSTVTILKLGPFVGTVGTVLTALTIAQGDVRLSKAGGNMAQKSTATACVHDELGVFFCDVSAADTDTLGRLRVDVDKSGSAALAVFHIYDVVTAQYWNTKYGTGRFEVDVQEIDGASAGAINMQNFYDGTGYAGGSIQLITTPGNGTMTAGVFAANALTAGTFASSFITAAKFGADAIDAAAIAGSALVAASFAAGALVEGAASAATIAANALGASAATITGACATSLSNIDLDHLINNGASVPTPTAGTIFDDIMNKDGSQNFSAATDSLEALRDRGDAAWATGAGASATTIAAACGTALTSYDGPTEAEMNTAHALLATPAQVNAQVLDVMATDTFAEPGQAAPPSTASIVTKIGYAYKFVINKIISGSAQIAIYDGAGNTVDQKSTISDDGNNFTRGAFGSGP